MNARILLIADPSGEINLLADTLKSIGYQVTILASPNETFSYLDDNRTDLIIADIGRDDTNDNEFFRTLKRDYPDLPVILIAGTESPSVLQATSAEGLVSKPYRISHIEDLIDKFVVRSSDAKESGDDSSILVVDDDDAFRTMLLRSLKYYGYNALGAADGKMAVDILQKQNVGAVIADVSMPYMDGITLLKHIKGRWPAIPVILITGYYSADESPAQEGMQADGFLMKPFKIKRIIQILNNITKETENS